MLLSIACSCYLTGQASGDRNVDSISFYSWDELTEKWIQENKQGIINYKYSSNGLLTEKISNRFNEESQTAEKTFREVYKYDSTGNVVEIISFQWINNGWTATHREATSYHSDKDPSENIYFEWDHETNGWINKSRIVYPFDPLDTFAVKLYYTWDQISNGWVKILQNKLEYNEEDESAIETIAEWNKNSNSWIKLWQIESDSITELNQSQQIVHRWDQVSQRWVAYSFKVSSHAQGGRILDTHYRLWSTEINDWINEGRESYVYSVNGAIKEYLHMIWDDEKKTWINQWKEESIYSANGNSKEEIIYIWKLSAKGAWDAEVSFDLEGNWFGLRQNLTNEPYSSEMNDSEHDTNSWKEKKKKIYWCSTGANSVFIPDAAFFNALLEEGVDVDEDSIITYEEAERVTVLDVGGTVIKRANNELISRGIKDMRGIEAFVNLRQLRCAVNEIENIDLSNNIFLVSLDCSQNQIKELNTSANSLLSYLDCSYNQVSLLNVTMNSELKTLFCQENELDRLNIETNVTLNQLNCSNNPIVNLNISQNVLLAEINVSSMPTLQEVCVWVTPFPTEHILVDSSGSPNLTYITDCVLNLRNIPSVEPSFYPNPAGEMLTVNIVRSGPCTIEIIDQRGRVQLRKQINEIPCNLDISTLAEGIYFIKFNFNTNVAVERLIKL